MLVTLTDYITSEMDAGLKRKMFSMSDGRDLGQLLAAQSKLPSGTYSEWYQQEVHKINISCRSTSGSVDPAQNQAIMAWIEL